MRQRFPWIAFALVALLVLIAVAAPYLPLENPLRIRVAQRMAGPSWDAWLGRDEFGRDVFSRIVWGARSSLTVAFLSAAIACVVGSILGLIGGFVRGVAEWLTMRSMDVLLCFPPLLLALLAVALIGPGVATLIPVLAFIFVPGFTRVAYSGVLSVRSQDFVEAMRALGAKPLRIMLRTILPNIAGPILVQFSLVVATAIVLESGLSFLGLGVVPPTPSWGLMIGSARATMAQQPLLLLWPCIALTLAILLMNRLCDGLRDMFDPSPAYANLFDRTRRALLGANASAPASKALLEVNNLTIATNGPDNSRFQPVRDLALELKQGETLAIVGESGSGKSLTGLSIMGLLPPGLSVRAGSIRLDGHDIPSLDEAELRRLRGATVSMIFQDPMSSLNPVHRVSNQIAEAILAHQPVSRPEAQRKAVELISSVGIPDPAVRARAFPHELSGGMRQRIMIAMAIANDPVLLIADEPTTALDVTIQAQVLELLADLKSRRGLAMIFISHSLPVVRQIADRLVVVYAGEVVEEGPSEAIFNKPRHPYTAALIACAPTTEGIAPRPIEGVVPPPTNLPKGCVFAPRCSLRQPDCETVRPGLVATCEGHKSRCLHWDRL